MREKRKKDQVLHHLLHFLKLLSFFITSMNLELQGAIIESSLPLCLTVKRKTLPVKVILELPPNKNLSVEKWSSIISLLKSLQWILFSVQQCLRVCALALDTSGF